MKFIKEIISLFLIGWSIVCILGLFFVIMKGLVDHGMMALSIAGFISIKIEKRKK